MTKLDWDEIDFILRKQHLNLLWLSEAVRTNGFNTDSLSKCQMISKFYLIKLLADEPVDEILIAGAWYGQLAQMLNDANVGSSYTGVDFDRSIAVTAERLNRHINYKHVIADMYDYDYNGYDTVINTSCEHIPNLKEWLDLLPEATTVILQSNNYTELEEHINCSESIEDFANKADLHEVMVSHELELPLYTRYTIIGRT